MPEYTHKLNISATSILPIETSACFNTAYIEVEKSPIDSFFEKALNLNIIHVHFSVIPGITGDQIETQNNLILLGYISAVESYLREIIRKLIIIDKASRLASQKQQLTYGAALNYPSHLLPESLLERSSYASKENIINDFKNFLGIKGQHTPNELITMLDEFEIICHLRHCIIHRFGKLGSNNAIKFGLDKHTNCLEKPVSIDAAKLYSIYQICENTVLVINQYLYTKILSRTVDPEFLLWKWDLRKDRKNFKTYYDLFKSSIKGDPASDLNSAYTELRNYKISL